MSQLMNGIDLVEQARRRDMRLAEHAREAAKAQDAKEDAARAQGFKSAAEMDSEAAAKAKAKAKKS